MYRTQKDAPVIQVLGSKNMAQINKSYASLRISGDDLIPTEISTLLGYEASLVQVKGQVFVGKNTGRERIAKSGMWRVKATDSEPENLDLQISEILDKLSSDLNVWKSLTERFDIDLFCGLFMEVSNEGMEITAHSLSLLAERGIMLGLDIYAPDDGGPNYDDLCPCESGKIYGECCAKIDNA